MCFYDVKRWRLTYTESGIFSMLPWIPFTAKWPVRPANTQISPGIRPVWSESSLSLWIIVGPLATLWAQSKDTDQIGREPRSIWVFAGRTSFCCFCRAVARTFSGPFILGYSEYSVHLKFCSRGRARVRGRGRARGRRVRLSSVVLNTAAHEQVDCVKPNTVYSILYDFLSS